MKRLLFFFAVVFSVCVARGQEKQAEPKPPGQSRLVVHEWGTFTSLQDEDGKAIGGINTDDEPVPDFVHRLSDLLLIGPTELPPRFFQGVPSCHPDVTMRLETPVIYFHPPADWKPGPVDVHVAFHGGWLTEYYPNAGFNAPGFDVAHADAAYTEKSEPMDFRYGFGHIKETTVGELSWNGLTLHAEGAGPATREKVWLSPRAVASTSIKTAAGETEKFLFYRGVAHADAALRIARDKSGMLEIGPQPENAGPFHSDAAWLVDVMPGGATAFKALGELNPDGKNPQAPFASAPGSFPAKEHSQENSARLRKSMRVALIKAGLFADEADALLNTWQVSYFKSPGLRFFYLCPRAEVDGRLPLDISVPATVTRVMVGRIELVTPGQRALLARIAAGPAPDMKGITFPARFGLHPESDSDKTWRAVMAGTKPLSATGLRIPGLYVDYLKLGRFRNALILDEQERRPTKMMDDFITANGLEAYKIIPQTTTQEANP